MTSMVLGWFKLNAALFTKAGTAAAGGTGILYLVMSLHSEATAKMDQQKVELKEYVELKLDPINVNINNLNNKTNDTNKMVRDLHNHLLNKRSN